MIDLGTNTFTMLIAEVNVPSRFDIIFHDRAYVKLAKDGIDSIGEIPYKTALLVLNRFKTALTVHGVQVTKALGTAAFRTASNGQSLVDEIYCNTGIIVDIIGGDEEATLIYEGVKYAYPMSDQCDLIMDIGGGSVEFIIANKEKVFWAKSFPIGVAVLKNNFHHQDPISEQERKALLSFLNQEMVPLFQAIQTFSIRNLIGASGTFDIIEQLFTKKQWSNTASLVEVREVMPFLEQVIHLPLEERKRMPSIPDERVEMIVVALILIEFVLKKFRFQYIGISSYAMKEGMMSLLVKSK